MKKEQKRIDRLNGKEENELKQQIEEIKKEEVYERKRDPVEISFSLTRKSRSNDIEDSSSYPGFRPRFASDVLTNHQSMTITQLQKALQQACEEKAKAIEERDRVIEEREKAIEDRDEAILEKEKMRKERDHAREMLGRALKEKGLTDKIEELKIESESRNFSQNTSENIVYL